MDFDRQQRLQRQRAVGAVMCMITLFLLIFFTTMALTSGDLFFICFFVGFLLFFCVVGAIQQRRRMLEQEAEVNQNAQLYLQQVQGHFDINGNDVNAIPMVMMNGRGVPSNGMIYVVSAADIGPLENNNGRNNINAQLFSHQHVYLPAQTTLLGVPLEDNRNTASGNAATTAATSGDNNNNSGANAKELEEEYDYGSASYQPCGNNQTDANQVVVGDDERGDTVTPSDNKYKERE